MTREEAIDVLKHNYPSACFTDLCEAVEIAIQALSAQPERKTEKWEQIEVNYFADMDDEIKKSMAIASMFCPKCKRYHNEVYLYGNPTYGVNFCPACGVDMRGKTNESD